MIKISASTHPAKSNYMNYFKQLENAGIDMLHCDVMDGKFVNDVTINHTDVAKIDDISTIVLDVHLMVKNPYELVKAYALSGANILTVHYEAFKSKSELLKTLKLIKDYHMLAGVSINPETSVEVLYPILKEIDLVLIMSVEPGKSGQQFLNNSLEKIKQLKLKNCEQKLNCLIEVDGGVNNKNAQQIISNGADILVVGSYLYKSEDKPQAIKNLKK